MTTVDKGAIERFMQGQVACWNRHDKEAFMALYREMASESLDIEYVGRPAQDGWFVIEEMWDKHNGQFELGVVSTIINGNEAAIHHHNKIIGTVLFGEVADGAWFNDLKKKQVDISEMRDTPLPVALPSTE